MTAGNSVATGKVRATSGSVSGEADVSVVTAEITSISVTPASAILVRGQTQNFSAAAFDQQNNPVTFTPTWSVVGTIGTVSAEGVFTATTAGTGQVRASSGSINGEAEVIVSGPGPTLNKSVVAYLPTSWDAENAFNSFINNVNIFSEICPVWYSLNSDGSIFADEGTGDEQIISICQANSIKIIPLINNYANSDFDPARVSAIINNTTNRANHIQNLVNLVEVNNYHGIEIDYENLYASDRNAFTQFIQELAQALHNNGKLLTIAVHAKTSEPGTWNGPQAQDWQALGQAVDYFRIMTYDYHWSTGSPGPIAPLGWDEAVINFAKTRVTSEKIYLGLASYGWNWGTGTASEVSHSAAVQLASAQGATITWTAPDEDGYSVGPAPHFSYTEGGITRQVWFEDATSWSPKLDLVNSQAIRGINIWRLGTEDPTVGT